MPPGVPYIVANEAAERFSFYGMRAILVVFMTQYMVNAQGLPDHMSDDQAKEWFHLFLSAVYFLPLLGAIISDAFLGKYLTILILSLVYCMGHAALALDSTRSGLMIGLGLIALGAGGIKPCVSAHVGDQFGATNQHLLPRVFSWFYFSINFGSAISTFIIPIILANSTWFSGPHYAFAVPGVLMLLATGFFWMGRWKFVHIPPGGAGYLKEVLSVESLKIILHLGIIYLFAAAFWSLYDQISSSWVLQAKHMDLHWLGRDWLPAQLQIINPVLILVFVPLFSYVIYPAINTVFPLTALRKISIGLFVMIPSFLIPTWIEMRIGQGAHPTIAWHALAYVFLTAAEVFVSITCLEFSYTQAPKRMKSTIMSLFLLSISIGDLFTACVNKFIQNPDGTSKLPGAYYYLFFVGLMFITAVIFIFVAMIYKPKTFIQDEATA